MFFSDFSHGITHRGNIKHKHHFYCVGDTIKVMFLFHVLSIKGQIYLKLVQCFCYYSASTKTSFGFFSCSEIHQLKYGSKKNVAGKCKLLSPQDSFRVANERYLPYLQLCENAFFVNFLYCRC